MKTMDFSLPVAKRTRLREAEHFKKLHDEIRRRNGSSKNGSSNGPIWVQESSFGDGAERNGEGLENSGSKVVVLDENSEDEVVYKGETVDGVFKESMECVFIGDSDDDDDDSKDERETLESDIKEEKSDIQTISDDDEGLHNSHGEDDGDDGDDECDSDEEIQDNDDDDDDEKKKDCNGVVNDGGTIVLGDDDEEYESENSHSKEDGEDEDEDVFEESEEEDEDPEDTDYRVSSSENFDDQESGGEEDGEEEDTNKQGTELKRKTEDRVESSFSDSEVIRIESSDTDMNGRVAKHRRRSKRAKLRNDDSDMNDRVVKCRRRSKRAKLGMVSQPHCAGEERQDHNYDESDNKFDKAGDVVKQGTRGGKGADVDGNEAHQIATQDLRRRKPGRRKRALKEPEVIDILARSILDEAEEKIGSLLDEEEEKDEPIKEPELPQKFTFGIEEPPPPEKTEEEKMMDELWADLALALQSKDAPDDAMEDGNESDADPEAELDIATCCRRGDHFLILEDEIGVKCKYCSFVRTEIKYYVPPFARNPYGRSERRGSSAMHDGFLDELDCADADYGPHSGSGPCSPEQGTVWNLVPGIGRGLHKHQIEGFEFLWKNIAGGIHLDKLKEQNGLNGGSGCIISHAPGTGKTRLTIVFLQTYMKLYPMCRPVIVAPSSMLLNWEAEFSKWKFDIPFHNLNNPEFLGKENKQALSLLKRARHGQRSSNTTHVVKLYSWKKESSVLGISYRLFEKMVGEEDKRSRAQNQAEHNHMRKVLLEVSDLLVLDEGHTPRNERSLIWKALSKVQTQKRIILSGTPFQNNFDELYNTLFLANPTFADEIPSERHRALPKRRGRNRSDARGKWASLTTAIAKDSDDKQEALRLEKLRKMMQPFVHVHKGDVLRRLPGLRDSVLLLEPVDLQKNLLENVKSIKTSEFDMERMVSLLSVHPSLSLKMMSLATGMSVDEWKLQRLRSKPKAGVKTKFLMELIRLCEVRNEKVLIFSQFLDPLEFVMEHLKAKFNWNPGEDMFYMHGKLRPDERQSLIKDFNDANNAVKVMLASTRACSEGINLVGASRVVLLDVVWNPSVERQAISRAYRLGQEKVVYVYHLIASGTMEEEKYFRQVEKERLSELVFDSTNRSNGQRVVLDVADDKKDKVLEEMVQHDKLKSIFKKIVYQPKTTNLVKSFGLDL